MAPAQLSGVAGHQHGDSWKAIGDYERRSDFVVVAGGKMKCPTRYPTSWCSNGNYTRKYLKKHPQRHPHVAPPQSLCYMSISNGELGPSKGSQMSDGTSSPPYGRRPARVA